MHAASVYPEPGSNSLNMIYQGCFATIIPSLSALLTLKSSLFLNSKEFSESFTFCHCCSIFKELRCRFLSDSFVIISKPLFFVNTFFKVFSKFFLKLSARLSAFCSCSASLTCFRFSVFTVALADCFVIISAHTYIVNYFFHLFSPSIFLTISFASIPTFCAL